MNLILTRLSGFIFLFSSIFAMEEREAALPGSASNPELTRMTSFLHNRTCPICFEEFKSRETIRILGCSHAFHEGCIEEWAHSRKKCPTCRQDISIQELKDDEFRIIALDPSDKELFDKDATFRHINILWLQHCSLCGKDVTGKDRIVSGCKHDHTFHYECIQAWRKKSPKYRGDDSRCPTCQKEKFKMLKEEDCHPAHRAGVLPPPPYPDIPVVRSENSLDEEESPEFLAEFFRNFGMRASLVQEIMRRRAQQRQPRVRPYIAPIPQPNSFDEEEPHIEAVPPIPAIEHEEVESCISRCFAPLLTCLRSIKRCTKDCCKCTGNKCASCDRSIASACGDWKYDCNDVSEHLLDSDGCDWNCPLNLGIRSLWATCGPPSPLYPDCLAARCCCSDQLDGETSAKIAAARAVVCCAGCCALCWWQCNIPPTYWLSFLD